MYEKQFLKPAPDLLVRDPHTGKHLPEAGDEVEFTPYWRRRLRDGDVIKAKKPRARKEK